MQESGTILRIPIIINKDKNKPTVDESGKILRIPIIMKDKTRDNPKLEWDFVYKKFVNLVKHAAKEVYLDRANYIDQSLSVEDLYQIGVIKLYDIYEKYNHLPIEEFKMLFTTSLYRAIKDAAKPRRENDLETALLTTGEAPTYEVESGYERMAEEIRDNLDSDIAVAVLCEIINPSPKTLWHSWADRARKMCLRDQGKKVNLPRKAEVKYKHIRDSLGITSKQFDNAIKEIKFITELVINKEREVIA